MPSELTRRPSSAASGSSSRAADGDGRRDEQGAELAAGEAAEAREVAERRIDGVANALQLQADVAHADEGGEGPEHVVGPFADRVDPGVADHPLEGLVGEIGQAAVKLKRVAEDSGQRFGGKDLEHGRFEHEVAFAGVDQGGRLIGAGLHRERAGLHVGQLLLDQLEIAQRLAELDAALGVLDAREPRRTWPRRCSWRRTSCGQNRGR